MTTQNKPLHDAGLQPLVVLIYGPSGAGKTTDAVYSFPNALHIASRGALLPAQHVCGYQPAEIAVSTIDEATQQLQRLSSQGAKYDSVVVDDFSYVVEKTFTLIEQKYARSNNNFAKFSDLARTALQFRDTARHMNCHVILNCWEKAPRSQNGQSLKGGPQLTGKLVDAIPALCDVVYRTGFEPMRKPWAGVYRCNQSEGIPYIMKDRTHIGTQLGTMPMNMGEIFRAAGYPISRLQGLEWQEDFVEQAAQQMLANGSTDHQIANDLYKSLLDKGIDFRAARWTLRDAMDRAVLRRGLTAAQQQFIA
jgi:hypothetical protein